LGQFLECKLLTSRFGFFAEFMQQFVVITFFSIARARSATPITGSGLMGGFRLFLVAVCNKEFQ